MNLILQNARFTGGNTPGRRSLPELIAKISIGNMENRQVFKWESKLGKVYITFEQFQYCYNALIALLSYKR